MIDREIIKKIAMDKMCKETGISLLIVSNYANGKTKELPKSYNNIIIAYLEKPLNKKCIQNKYSPIWVSIFMSLLIQ